MVALYFIMEKVPRTVGRKEWYEIYRKVRVQRKECRTQESRLQELLREKGKEMHPRIRRDIMDSLIYPPLILGPYMDGQW